MTNATMELYNALVEAGVDKDKAEKAAKAVISREEVDAFVTKGDLQAALHSQTRWIVGTFLAVSLGQIAVMTAIVSALLDVQG